MYRRKTSYIEVIRIHDAAPPFEVEIPYQRPVPFNHPCWVIYFRMINRVVRKHDVKNTPLLYKSLYLIYDYQMRSRGKFIFNYKTYGKA